MADTPQTRRSNVIRYDNGQPRMTFAYINPKGHLRAVVDATDIAGAWHIATGAFDLRGIAQRRAKGWRVVPCMVEWQA